MSAVDDLQPLVQPKPVEKTLCSACKAFAAQCLVPDGDGAVPACWECAHHMVVHNRVGKQAMLGRCECPIEEIYPKRVLDERRAMSAFLQRHWANRSPS